MCAAMNSFGIGPPDRREGARSRSAAPTRKTPQPMTTRIAITAAAYAAIRESLPPAGSRPPQEVGDLYLVSVPTDTMDKLADPAQAGRELQRRDHRDGGGGTRLTTQSQSARVALSAGPPPQPQTNLKSRATRFVIVTPTSVIESAGSTRGPIADPSGAEFLAARA